MADEPALARTLAASVTQRIACGEQAGQQVRRIGSGFGYEGESPTLTGPRCASVHGFSLHANTQVPAHRRDQLERLLRYTARGAVALERLAEDTNGDLVYTFTTPWFDGTTGITLSPLELLEKLAALVPLPRRCRRGGAKAATAASGACVPDTRSHLFQFVRIAVYLNSHSLFVLTMGYALGTFMSNTLPSAILI
jgi:hypothetical protein